MGTEYYLINEDREVGCEIGRGYFIWSYLPSEYPVGGKINVNKDLIIKCFSKYVRDCAEDIDEEYPYFKSTCYQYLKMLDWLMTKAKGIAFLVSEYEIEKEGDDVLERLEIYCPLEEQ
jgi:hypothetical protein